MTFVGKASDLYWHLVWISSKVLKLISTCLSCVPNFVPCFSRHHFPCVIIIMALISWVIHSIMLLKKEAVKEKCFKGKRSKKIKKTSKMNDLMSYEVCYLRKQKCTEKQNKRDRKRIQNSHCIYIMWLFQLVCNL